VVALLLLVMHCGTMQASGHSIHHMPFLHLMVASRKAKQFTRGIKPEWDETCGEEGADLEGDEVEEPERVGEEGSISPATPVLLGSLCMGTGCPKILPCSHMRQPGSSVAPRPITKEERVKAACQQPQHAVKRK
jgi:hypothetical protein